MVDLIVGTPSPDLISQLHSPLSTLLCRADSSVSPLQHERTFGAALSAFACMSHELGQASPAHMSPANVAHDVPNKTMNARERRNHIVPHAL